MESTGGAPVDPNYQGEDEFDFPETIHEPMPLTDFPRFQVAVETNIGCRRNQEDRFTVCPKLLNERNDCAFFGVFDGTVGDFASDTIKSLIVPHLLAAPAWSRVCAFLRMNASPGSGENGGLTPEEEAFNGRLSSAAALEALPGALTSVMNELYVRADQELVERCRQEKNDYASSTSVTALLAGNLVAVGHVGDSRIAIGFRRGDGRLGGVFLTNDHKPDLPGEHRRIMSCGGSVEYLQNHDNKPFIRGGDFGERKANGETPMQLQYSRAFGGKDLKSYGLSCQPDVRVIPISEGHRVLILATDGLWDVLSAEHAVEIACNAFEANMNPAKALVEHTLSVQNALHIQSDNITAMTVFFKH